MKNSLSKARVGFLIFLGVLAFSVGIFFVGEKSHMFSSVFYVQANFPAAEGVKPGGMVVLSGYNVGTVVNISLSDQADSVRLLLRLREDIRPFIKNDSKAEIKQEGLVGNKIINITIGSKDKPPVRDYGYIEGVPPFALTGLADNVTALTDTAKQISGEVHRLIGGVNEGKGSVGKLFSEEELYLNVLRITEQTSAGLQQTTERLNTLAELLIETVETVKVIAAKADTAMDNTNRITAGTSELVDKMNAGEGTVGALLSDRALYDSLVTLINALTYVSYDAGDAADQAARSIHAMREHWLFGRVFGGEEFEQEPVPEPSYREQMRRMMQLKAELDRRQAELEQKERELGLRGTR